MTLWTLWLARFFCNLLLFLRHSAISRYRYHQPGMKNRTTLTDRERTDRKTLVSWWSVRSQSIVVYPWKVDMQKRCTVKRRSNGLPRKCNPPLLENVCYSKKTQILPSLNVNNTFWLKSLYYCYVAETSCAWKVE